MPRLHRRRDAAPRAYGTEPASHNRGALARCQRICRALRRHVLLAISRLGPYTPDGMKVMVTKVFAHTGPRHGNVFAEPSFAKQIAMIEAHMLPPIVNVGNPDPLHTIADVHDAERSNFMMATMNPRPGAYYDIMGSHTCTVEDILETLRSMSTVRNVGRQVDTDRSLPICKCRTRGNSVPTQNGSRDTAMSRR